MNRNTRDRQRRISSIAERGCEPTAPSLPIELEQAGLSLFAHLGRFASKDSRASGRNVKQR